MIGLAAIALAGPQFTSKDPKYAEIASAAWLGAVMCTGWEAEAEDIVEIRVGDVAAGYTGLAEMGDRGLSRISVGGWAPERSIVHEVAHGWVRKGPATLTEGRADLLADCVVRLRPELAPLDPDSGEDLDAMPDLRRWSNTRTVGPDGDVERRHAYLAAGRFLRVVSIVVAPESLWPETGQLRWRDMDRLLEQAGPAGATVLSVLDAGVERQRLALSDRDRDGVPWLGEVLQGTDPDRWDSDGDGWWDGAVPPLALAVPLPQDGTPVCSGYAAGDQPALVTVAVHAEGIRGIHVPKIRVRTGDTVRFDDPSEGVFVPAGEPILLVLDTPSPVAGGLWVVVGGSHLVPEWNCRSTPNYTVWVDDPFATVILDQFVTALDEQVRRGNTLLDGPSGSRLVVVLGATSAGVADGVVRLSTGLIRWSVENERPDALAALAVALHHVWQGDEKRWDTAEGLARALMDDPPYLTFVAVDDEAAEAWLGQAERCGEGWTGVLQGRCDEAGAPVP